MKLKMLITVGIFCTLLTACTYKPVIDSSGRSGTFTESKSDNITNDLLLCEELAKNNTNMLMESGKYVWNYYFRPATLWLSPKAEYDYNKIYKNCMSNRGHAILK